MEEEKSKQQSEIEASVKYLRESRIQEISEIVVEVMKQIKPQRNFSEIAKALCKAQAEMNVAKKDGNNPHFKSTYATFQAVTEAVKGPLTKHGLSYTQLPTSQGNLVSVKTILFHGESGEYLENTLQLQAVKPGPQAIGSAITYARRYSLQAICGLAVDEDDDANQAAGPAQNKQGNSQAPQQPRQRPKASPPQAPLQQPWTYVHQNKNHQGALLKKFKEMNEDLSIIESVSLVLDGREWNANNFKSALDQVKAANEKKTG